jgi:hypothetical protein
MMGLMQQNPLFEFCALCALIDVLYKTLLYLHTRRILVDSVKSAQSAHFFVSLMTTTSHPASEE